MDNGNKDCVPEALSKLVDADDSGGKRGLFIYFYFLRSVL